MRKKSNLHFFESFSLNSALFADSVLIQKSLNPAYRQAGAKKIPRYRKARKENCLAQQIITLTKRHW
jgi:hypothetical protein